MQRFDLGRAEVGAAALLALVGLAEMVTAEYERPLVGIASYLLAAAGVAFSRKLPLLVTPFVACVYALTPLAGFDVSEPAAWMPLLAAACFVTGVHARPAQWPLGLAATAFAFGLVYAALTWLTALEPSVLFGTAVTLGPWALGLALRQALERERRAGARAERARRDAALARERAVTAERERVAGETHDLLAHALGAMVVQASAARDALRRNDARAVRRLTDVADAGRDALAETAALVRALRDRREMGESGSHIDAAPEEARRIMLRDALLPALLAVIAVGEIVSNEYGSAAVGIAAYGTACLALSVRRAFPRAMPLVVTALLVAASLGGFDLHDTAAAIPIVGLACFAAGRHLENARRMQGAATVVASTLLLLVDVVRATSLSADGVLLLVFTFAPWGIGVALRTTLARAHTHAAEAERARLDGQADVERGRSEERRRIARELHDVLAASLSLMTVQASVAADLSGSDPAGAEKAVAEVEQAGRLALDQTGVLLRMIRDGDGERHPQHGAGDLPALVAEYERAGLAVDLERGNLDHIPAGVEASLYRIVQEALTNALKHAPGSRVRISLTRTASGVEVEVVNTAPAGDARARVPSGHGLLGLRERVSLYGGRLDARPTADGGFELAASIPVGDPR